MANPLTTALQIGIEQGREQERIANKPRDTGNPLNDMTGIGGGKPLPKGTPAPKEMQLPIPGVDWRKFLVELMINPQIAGSPSFTVGGGQSSSRNKKIMSSGDANAPNAKEFMEKLQLGPAMFPIKKADAQGLTNFLSPHQNPRSGSLRDSGLSDEEKIQLLIRGAEIYKQASHDNRQFKSVPATGVRGDQPAGEIRDFLNRKDENILQTQNRLRGV